MGIRPLTALLGLFFLTSTSLAQDSSTSLAQDSASRARNVSALGNKFDPWTNPALGPYAPESPGDADLGEQRILQPASGYRPFNFSLIQHATWTDNAALTEIDELSDWYSTTELRMSYLPRIAGNTYGEISAGYSFFRYFDHSSLDFDSLEASLGGLHVFRDLNDLSGWLRYNHTRLLEGRGHDEIFTDHAIELGLYYPIPIAPGHFAYGAYTSEFSLDGNPGYAARHEHGVTLGYKYSPTDRIELDAYYRLFVHDYLERGRDDLLHIAGLALTTRVTEGIDFILSASYSINDSDAPGGDYEAGELGAILSLNVNF